MGSNTPAATVIGTVAAAPKQPRERRPGKVAMEQDGLVGQPGFDRNRVASVLSWGRESAGPRPNFSAGGKKVSRSDRRNSGTGNNRSQNRSDARWPRSIRFADSEWKLIGQAALRHGIPASELVRAGALALAEDQLGESPPATLTSGHLALIEDTYRSAYIMATLMREELLDAGHKDDVQALVDAARKTMKQTMNEGPA